MFGMGGLGGGGAITITSLISLLASSVSMPAFNNAMANARGGNAAGAKVAIIGDSTDVMGFTGGIAQGHGAKLANQLSSSGICNASFESVYATSGLAYSDSRMTFGGSFSFDSSIQSIGGDTRKATTTTNSDKFTPSIPVDRCRIQYVIHPAGGVISLSWSAVGAGGGIGTVSVNTNGADGLGFLELNIGSLQIAEFHVKYVSGTQVNWAYWEAWDSTRQPVRFLAFAKGATGSDDWSDDSTPYAYLPAMLAHVPDVIVLGSLVNDMGVTDLDPSLWSGVVAASKVKMEKILDAFAALPFPPDIIIRTQNPQNPSAGGSDPRRPVAYQDMMVDMVRGLADTYGAVLVDVYKNIGSYAAGSSLKYNFYGDTWVHLAAPGTSMIANQEMVALTFGTGAGNGFNPQPFFNSVNVSLDYKLRNSTILRAPGSGSLASGFNANPSGTGAWNTSYGDNTNNNGGGSGNDVSGYDALSTAGFKLNNTIRGKDCGKLLAAASNNNLSGNGVCSTVAQNINRCFVHGTSSYVTTPTSSTVDFFNLEDSIKGYSVRTPNGGLTIQGAESLIGVIRGANLNVTTDNIIPCPFIGTRVTISSSSGTSVTVASTTGVVRGMLLQQGQLSSVITDVPNATTLTVATTVAWAAASALAGLEFIVTDIIAKNASVNLTTSPAAGGIYTAPSKGGTAIVAAAQLYTALSAPTKLQRLTISAAGLADSFAVQNLYWSLTTAHGSAATADLYVYGKIV